MSSLTSEVEVLVVEDDSRSRENLCLLLENFGYACRSAGDGLEALHLLKTWKPQAIVMDINMPRLDGIEATRRIRADPATQAIPVVALTAASGNEEEQEAGEAGVNAFLTKPANLAALLGQLRQLAPSPAPAVEGTSVKKGMNQEAPRR